MPSNINFFSILHNFDSTLFFCCSQQRFVNFKKLQSSWHDGNDFFKWFALEEFFFVLLEILFSRRHYFYPTVNSKRRDCCLGTGGAKQYRARSQQFVDVSQNDKGLAGVTRSSCTLRVIMSFFMFIYSVWCVLHLLQYKLFVPQLIT